MAFIRVEPVEVQVRTNWFSGRPREITWGAERLPVTRLAVVREEAAAYPVITGPRTLFEVDTPRARLSLTFQHRSRRWTVTGLDNAVRPRGMGAAPSANPPGPRSEVPGGRLPPPRGAVGATVAPTRIRRHRRLVMLSRLPSRAFDVPVATVQSAGGSIRQARSAI
jgi:hypothetical protein